MYRMIERKTPEQIDLMAASGEILVRCLKMLASKARAGVTTEELDQTAEKFIRSQGAIPAFKGYRGFPGSICSSPNDMVVHGIPGPYELQRGDILSIDVGVIKDGWVADAAMTVPIGPIDREARKLLDVTKASLFAAVTASRVMTSKKRARAVHIPAPTRSRTRSLKRVPQQRKFQSTAPGRRRAVFCSSHTTASGGGSQAAGVCR